jgi:hypothetical protein
MKYERMTAASIREALELAEQVLLERLPLSKEAQDAHSIRLTGGDGTVRIAAHRHGVDTQVAAHTDQFRTSRLDLEVQYYLSLLPYQPGELRGHGEALPGGLSREPATKRVSAGGS